MTMQSRDYVYAGFVDNKMREVLTVRHKDDGMWYLPGGPVPVRCQIIDHARVWSEKLFRCGTIRLPDEHAGLWKLTNGGRVYLVKPLIHGLIDLDSVMIKHGTDNELITATAPMGIREIYDHLYVSKTMSWAQAKLALWAIYTDELTEKHGHQIGDPITDGIGFFKEMIWTRP